MDKQQLTEMWKDLEHSRQLLVKEIDNAYLRCDLRRFMFLKNKMLPRIDENIRIVEIQLSVLGV